MSSHRIFWHYNPMRQPWEPDTYHVAHVDKSAFVPDKLTGALSLQLKRGIKVIALCGAVGIFSVDMGYIADGEQGREYMNMGIEKKIALCVTCLLIEGERLLTVPDEEWLRPRALPRSRGGRR